MNPRWPRPIPARHGGISGLPHSSSLHSSCVALLCRWKLSFYICGSKHREPGTHLCMLLTSERTACSFRAQGWEKACRMEAMAGMNRGAAASCSFTSDGLKRRPDSRHHPESVHFSGLKCQSGRSLHLRSKEGGLQSRVESLVFADQSHERFYSFRVRCGKKEKAGKVAKTPRDGEDRQTWPSATAKFNLACNCCGGCWGRWACANGHLQPCKSTLDGTLPFVNAVSVLTPTCLIPKCLPVEWDLWWQSGTNKLQCP